MHGLSVVKYPLTRCQSPLFSHMLLLLVQQCDGLVIMDTEATTADAIIVYRRRGEVKQKKKE